jgi:hypothetical protein
MRIRLPSATIIIRDNKPSRPPCMRIHMQNWPLRGLNNTFMRTKMPSNSILLLPHELDKQLLKRMHIPILWVKRVTILRPSVQRRFLWQSDYKEMLSLQNSMCHLLSLPRMSHLPTWILLVRVLVCNCVSHLSHSVLFARKLHQMLQKVPQSKLRPLINKKMPTRLSSLILPQR